MSNRKRRERRRKEQAARQVQAAPLQPGTANEIELRRQIADLRSENRTLRAQLGSLYPDEWPPRYRDVLNRLAGTLLELGEEASPLQGRVLRPAGRSGPTESLRDEGAPTRAARRMQDRIVKDVNGVIDNTYNPTLTGKRCRRSPNQCPMSGKVQTPRFADHLLDFCGGCGYPFPADQRQETA